LRISGGERYGQGLYIDYKPMHFLRLLRSRACPTDAITHGHGFEIASYNTSTLIYRKERMLVQIPAAGAFPVEGEEPVRSRRPLVTNPPAYARGYNPVP